MAKFEDTPQWKRDKVWDPVKQKLVSPSPRPTFKQLRLIAVLAADLGLEPIDDPPSSPAASWLITRLQDLKLRRAGA